MSNPYQSPQFATPTVAMGGDREKLRRVAKYQQWVINALAVNIAINIVAVVARGHQSIALSLGMLAVAVSVAVFAMVAIFLLARELYHIGIAVVCAILMIVPCISLIVLLVVNGKATAYLQQHGIKVGFLGTNPNTI